MPLVRIVVIIVSIVLRVLKMLKLARIYFQMRQHLNKLEIYRLTDSLTHRHLALFGTN